MHPKIGTKCPRCGDVIARYPATSRRDGRTPVCPECGVDEAFVDGGIVRRPTKPIRRSWPWPRG